MQLGQQAILTRQSWRALISLNQIKYYKAKMIIGLKLIQANHMESNNGNWVEFVRQTIGNWRKYPNFTLEELSTISAPFMLLYGSEDGTVKTDELVLLNKHIRNFKPVRVEGCGHRPHMIEGKPAELNKVMLEFLNHH